MAEVVFAAHSRIVILDGRTGLRKVDPYWTFSNTYSDVSALMLIDMNNDGHVDIVQNGAFTVQLRLRRDSRRGCDTLVGPIVLSGGAGNAWLPGPKAWPHLQYRSTRDRRQFTLAARHQGLARVPHAGAAGHGA